MAKRFVEWKSKETNEWEIMVWTYNYSKHGVVRYFRQDNGIVNKSEEL